MVILGSVLVLGCSAPMTMDEVQPVESVSDTGDGNPGAGDTGSETRDTSEPTEEPDPPEEPDPTEELPDVEDPGGWLYTLDDVHGVEIILGPSEWDSLYYDPYTVVPADLVVDGVRYPEVGVRLKGRLGSYRSLDGKAGFIVDINQYRSNQRLAGLEQLNLNNMVQDGAQLHDRVAYMLYNALGIEAPRVGFAWVIVKVEEGGEVQQEAVYGLYSNVEAYDDVFLDKRFEDGSGNLYDGDYMLWSNGAYSMVDFQGHLHHLFQQDEGEDVGLEDIHAITWMLDENAGRAGFYDAANALIDLEQFARMWAVEAWLGQYDGYAYNRNNYRVYFDPIDGRARFLPWDHDWAFYYYTPVTSPYGRLAQACKSDPYCHQFFLDALVEASDRAEAVDMEGEIDRIAALIDPYVYSDPRREVSLHSVAAYRAELRRWINERRYELAATSGL